ncbi:MAG TPA: alpha/beta fold hydrolase [Solirubrobacteraceae bacterium]|jgi:pimeloyl-ACP methyl ester carboxylesterase
MLAFDREGVGPPLMLLHGTNSSRSIWKPLLAQLAREREVFSVDLPAHGQSPPSSFNPPAWARAVAALIDELGIERVAVVGHSAGGWTALELAKLGRASAVLALTPAGLWRRHSPPITDAILAINWRLGQLLGAGALVPLRTPVGRRLSLRQISARPAAVPPDVAIEMVATVLASKHFPEHFKQTRQLRFLDGRQISADIPVRVIWGDRDRIARARTSRHVDQLPAHTLVETWAGCGHMVMWDAPQRLLDAALALPTG